LRAQLLVASGKPLPWAQDGIAQRGHAIEGRIYAEDPAHDFLPQAGQILLYREPKRPGIRVDSGIDEGSNVPVQYDPLLAKVVATAETRDAAVRRLIAALRDFPILGIRTNVPFLLRILEHPALLAGTIDTGFLDTQGGALAETEPPQWPEVVLAAITAHEARAETGHQPPAAGRGNDPWETLRAWRG
jgi:acetyl-CoA/propionyl-CoA carboxylase biotin carboxyl carrier protein